MEATITDTLLVIADRLEDLEDPGCQVLRDAVDELKGGQPSQRKELLLFCGPDSWRYMLATPWVARGWVYATDSRIAVALKTNEPDSPLLADYPRRPNVRAMLDLVPQPETWVPLANLNIIPNDGDGVCWACFGLQRLPYDAKLTHTEECDVCHGTGGIEDGPTRMELNGCQFSRHYIEMIELLAPSAEVAAIPDDDKGNVLRFRFEGGEGLLMGMK